MPRRPLIVVLFAFLIGILLGHGLHPWPQNARLVLFVGAALVVAGLPFTPARWKGPHLISLFLLLGMIVEQGTHRPFRLTAMALNAPRVVMEGTLLETIQKEEGYAKFRVLAEAVSLHGKWLPVREPVLVTVYDQALALRTGQRTRFPATLKPFKNFNNPGGYDYEQAMALRGYACGASVSDGRRMVPMGPGRLPFPWNLVEHLRRPLRERFDRMLDPLDHGLMSALVLGERQGVGDEIREAFNRTGLSHVLAVSGLHIGMIAAIAFFLARRGLSLSYRLALRTDIRKVAAAISCVPVVAYTALAGFQVSSQRAMIMVLAFLLSLILGKERDVWSTLAFAALVILALDPHAIYSISFQLSFGAVTAILWMTPGLSARVRAISERGDGKGRPFLRPLFYVVGLAGATVSVTLFLLPLTCLYFQRIPLVAIPANLMVVPIVGFWILPGALLSAATAPLCPQLAEVLLKTAAWGLHGAVGVIRFWAEMPWGSVWTFIPHLPEMILFYAMIFLVFQLRKFRWAKGAFAVLLALALADAAYWFFRTSLHQDLRVTYLDVGQGNAALVEFPGGKRMLIDGGGFSRGHFDVGRMVVAPYLWRNKILTVHTLALSHPQADHMNGLRFIAEAFGPREFWHNGDRGEGEAFAGLMAALDARGIRKLTPEDLQTPTEIHGVRVEVLSPTAPGGEPGCLSAGDKLNDRSLVLKISYRGVSFLFPGDIEARGEECLTRTSAQALRSTVLLSPHHGSNTSNSEGFLRLVRPELTVVSSGSARASLFPHPRTLERLREVGSGILRIDQVGAVRCTVAENGLEVETCRGGRFRPLRWEAHKTGEDSVPLSLPSPPGR